MSESPAYKAGDLGSGGYAHPIPPAGHSPLAGKSQTQSSGTFLRSWQDTCSRSSRSSWALQTPLRSFPCSKQRAVISFQNNRDGPFCIPNRDSTS